MPNFQEYRICNCGHTFAAEVNVCGDYDPPDRPPTVERCEVCKSAPYATLTARVARLEEALKELLDDCEATVVEDYETYAKGRALLRGTP